MNSKEIYSKLIRDEYNRLVLAVDYDKMQKIIDNLQQRIDKAIEYINRCKNYHKSMHNEEKIYVDEIKELEDILRGKDNEK